jgi:hypothetical protein
MSCRIRFPFLSSIHVVMTYGILKENDMDVGGKYFVSDWVVHHSFSVLSLAISCRLEEVATYLEEVELDKLARIQWFT